MRKKEEAEEVSDSDAVERLDRVRRLHVLKLLKESDQFTWTGKLSGKDHLHTTGIYVTD
jgi:nucleolar pre-ribosomal-associated protein 1